MEFTPDELEVFAKGTKVFLAILNSEGKMIRLNDRWPELLKVTKEDLLGQELIQYIRSDERTLFDSVIKQALADVKVGRQTVTFIDAELKTHVVQYDISHFNNQLYLAAFEVTKLAEEHTALMEMSGLSRTGAWYYDPIRDVSYWSKEVYKIHEIDNHELVGADRALSFYISPYKEKINLLVNRLYEDHKPYDFSGEILTAKGNRKWIRTIAKPVIHNDKVIYVNGVTIDQTLLDRYIRIIKYQFESRNLALKGIKSGLFDYDLVNDLMMISPDFIKILGVRKNYSQMPGTELIEFIHPDDREGALLRIREDLRREGNHHENHYRLRLADGKHYHYKVYGWKKKDESGRVIRIVGNLINIHEQVVAQEEKAKIFESLKSMVDNGFVYSVLMDADGQILLADEDTRGIIRHDYGIDPHHTVVKYVDVMPDIFKAGFQDSFNKALSGETVRKEVERPLLDGAMQWLDVIYHPIKNEKGEIINVLTNLMDVTKWKRAEVSIREAEQKATALSELKSSILTNLSHELRTPLNGIMGTNYLLKDMLTDPEHLKLLEMQKESSIRLLKTLTNTLMLGDITMVRDNMNWSDEGINSILQICFDMYRHQANLKNLNFTITKDTSEPEANVDKELLVASLGAIVNNALKYTRQGSVELVCTSSDTEVFIEVKDTGVGIAIEDYDKVFEDFGKVNPGINYKYEGTGIGLSITKKFVELMNGTISVDSIVNRGSRFIIALPRT